MPATPYPDVPTTPGVPPVLRQVGRVERFGLLLVSDAAILARAFLGPQWGIFTKTGAPVVAADSVKGFDFRREWSLPRYPMEQGAFGTYNKVAEPFDCRVELTIGDRFLPNLPGSQVLRRRAFLAALEAAAGSLNLYTVATPEFRYASANIIHFDYRRTRESGAGLLTVAVWLQEVRNTATQQFAQAQTPAGAGAVNDGTVQTAPLTAVTSSPLPAPT
jgi:hypothetical protein